jgi:hypothetical protein
MLNAKKYMNTAIPIAFFVLGSIANFGRPGLRR